MEEKVGSYKKSKTQEAAPPPPPPSTDDSADPPPIPIGSPGFIERFVTQIIKNVQLVVKNVHVRFEDQITNPEKPFTAGLSLGRFVGACVCVCMGGGAERLGRDPEMSLDRNSVGRCLLYKNTLYMATSVARGWAGVVIEKGISAGRVGSKTS